MYKQTRHAWHTTITAPYEARGCLHNVPEISRHSVCCLNVNTPKQESWAFSQPICNKQQFLRECWPCECGMLLRHRKFCIICDSLCTQDSSLTIFIQDLWFKHGAGGKLAIMWLQKQLLKRWCIIVTVCTVCVWRAHVMCSSSALSASQAAKQQPEPAPTIQRCHHSLIGRQPTPATLPLSHQQLSHQRPVKQPSLQTCPT